MIVDDVSCSKTFAGDSSHIGKFTEISGVTALQKKNKLYRWKKYNTFPTFVLKTHRLLLRLLYIIHLPFDFDVTQYKSYFDFNSHVLMLC